jgi:hypothetical protein
MVFSQAVHDTWLDRCIGWLVDVVNIVVVVVATKLFHRRVLCFYDVERRAQSRDT